MKNTYLISTDRLSLYKRFYQDGTGSYSIGLASDDYMQDGKVGMAYSNECSDKEAIAKCEMLLAMNSFDYDELERAANAK